MGFLPLAGIFFPSFSLLCCTFLQIFAFFFLAAFLVLLSLPSSRVCVLPAADSPFDMVLFRIIGIVLDWPQKDFSPRAAGQFFISFGDFSWTPFHLPSRNRLGFPRPSYSTPMAFWLSFSFFFFRSTPRVGYVLFPLCGCFLSSCYVLGSTLLTFSFT